MAKLQLNLKSAMIAVAKDIHFVHTMCQKEVQNKALISIFNSVILCYNTLFFSNSSRKIIHAIALWIEKQIP